MKVGDFVLVKWLDTVTYNDWQSGEQALELELREVKVAGWIVVKNEEKLVVAAMTGIDHNLLACIPMRSVVSIKKVRE